MKERGQSLGSEVGEGDFNEGVGGRGGGGGARKMEDFEVWGVWTPATVSPSPDGASRGQRRAQVWGRRGVPSPGSPPGWGAGLGAPRGLGRGGGGQEGGDGSEEEGEEGREAKGSREARTLVRRQVAPRRPRGKRGAPREQRMWGRQDQPDPPPPGPPPPLPPRVGAAKRPLPAHEAPQDRGLGGVRRGQDTDKGGQQGEEDGWHSWRRLPDPISSPAPLWEGGRWGRGGTQRMD